MVLSKRDMRLVFELDSNYRRSYSEIGRKIRMSQQLINYKVKSFLNEGIVVGKCPLIDYSRFDYLTFRVYFKVNYANREKIKDMIETLKQHRNVVTLVECQGRYDLIVVFAAKNPSSFNKMLREIIAANPEQLKNCMILTTVVEHHFPRKYLIGSELNLDKVAGGDREPMQVDETDTRILKALIGGKKSVVEISQSSGTAPKTAISHLRRLEENEVIKGYRLILDIRKIGYTSKKVLIRFHNVSVERENQLKAFCQTHPNITELVKTFGKWDLEMTIETRTSQEFRDIYLTLREKFEDIIDDFDSLSIFRIHKKQALPDAFFEGIDKK